jgi:hypothetical protein
MHTRQWCTAVGVERVEVPAGTFDALRIECRTVVAGEIVMAREWWAPGIGLVRQIRGEGELVLKSFTPGKD